MDINIRTDIKISDLIADYANYGVDGVYALGGNLEVRPPYQREFVYSPEQSSAVIDSILHDYPIGIMYVCKKDDGTFECLDGQQRTISICEFYKNKVMVDIDGNKQTYSSLETNGSDKIKQFLDYELIVAECEGTDDEKLAWFERINTSGEPLTPQELRNAIYTGPWVIAAKKYFSHAKCAAYHKTEKNFGKLIKVDEPKYKKATGSECERQGWLEQVIYWKCEYDAMKKAESEQREYSAKDLGDRDDAIKAYMVAHRNNPNADDLTEYFDNMVEWVKRNFKYKAMMEKCDWGHLYNLYHNIDLKQAETDAYIETLYKNAKNDGITNPIGIYEFLFDGNVSHLSDRQFTSKEMKLAKWDEQGHKCAICGQDYPFEDLAADHKLPWCKGGTTTADNLQMLCAVCNGQKTSKFVRDMKGEVIGLRVIV